MATSLSAVYQLVGFVVAAIRSRSRGVAPPHVGDFRRMVIPEPTPEHRVICKVNTFVYQSKCVFTVCISKCWLHIFSVTASFAATLAMSGYSGIISKWVDAVRGDDDIGSTGIVPVDDECPSMLLRTSDWDSRQMCTPVSGEYCDCWKLADSFACVKLFDSFDEECPSIYLWISNSDNR